MSVVIIGLGSNLGDRQENLRRARDLLGGTVTQESSVYETEPVGLLDQPWFLNAVLELETNVSPREYLLNCQEIENLLGRVRLVSKGPRTIDLDILFYDDLIIAESDLMIPHPAISERRFVLEPLNEIAPRFIHPVEGKSISYLLQHCSDPSIVRLSDRF